MPTLSLADVRKEFHLALDELAGRLEFIRLATRIRPRLADMLHWKHMDTEAKRLAQSFLKQRPADGSLLHRGLFIVLAGAFEHFVRRLVRDSVGAVNKSGRPYDLLDQVLRQHNVCRTGMALQTIFEPVDYLTLDFEVLSRNIGTCFSGSPEPVLNADAFAIYLTTISAEKLDEALSRVGVKLDWNVFGEDTDLRNAFEKKATRETANALRDFLDRFGQTRNRVAHSGIGGLTVTDTDLEQYIRVFRTFSTLLGSAVESQLSKMLRRKAEAH